MSIESGHVAAPDGVRIAFRVDGEVDRPAILFCSMGTAALAVWDSLAEPLSAHWRLIRYDRRGDGDSDPGVEESHSFSTYVRDALMVMDRCQCRSAVVCGMAFGARVALHLARDAPERVDGLVLFDATGGPPAPEAERSAGRAEAARLRKDAGLADIAPDPKWFFRRDRSGGAYARNALKAQPDWMSGLSAIKARTLIACGEQDPNLHGAMRLAREIPWARFVSMPMTGHGSILDRPDLVRALLEGFLSQPTVHLGGAPSTDPADEF